MKQLRIINIYLFYKTETLQTDFCYTDLFSPLMQHELSKKQPLVTLK